MDNLPVPARLVPNFASKDEVMKFYEREANASHDVLDELGVPRMEENERLSLSQRMKSLHDSMLKFNVSLRKYQEWLSKQP